MSLNTESLDRLRPKELRKAKDIIYVDPEKVVKDNPASLVFSQEIYDRITQNFSIDLLDPIQIVRVAIFSSQEENVIRTLAADGIHRARAIADNKGEKLPDGSGWFPELIPAKDVTDAYINMPYVVLEEERVEGQNALTMIQYLRVVIPWTKEHSEIAPERIAAHLTIGWKSIVGEKLAERFSALAAFNFLRNPNVPSDNTEGLTTFLASQDELLVDIRDNERERLEQGLIQVAQLIQEADLEEEGVAQAAFALIIGEAEAIGGESQARSEVYGLLYGLLYSPKVEQALKQRFPESLAELELRRTRLGELVYEVLCREEQKILDITTLLDAITDPFLSVDQISEVLQTDRPAYLYDTLKNRSVTDHLIQLYLAGTSREELTEIEIRLVENLAQHYDSDKIEEYIETINNSARVMINARLLTAYIDERWDYLIEFGFSEEDLKLMRIKLVNQEGPILNSKKLSNITRYSETLTSTITELRGKIADLEKYSQDTVSKPASLSDSKKAGQVIRDSDTKDSSPRQRRNSGIIRRRSLIEIGSQQSPNNQLVVMLGSLNYQLATREILFSDLNQETIDWLDKILRQLGQIRYNHPDIVEIIDDYLRISEEIGSESHSKLD